MVHTSLQVLLKSLCPLCTIVHLIVLITLILTIPLYKSLEIKPKNIHFFKTIKYWIISLVIVCLLIFGTFNIPLKEKNNSEDLAKCITSKGINLYSSFRCGHCLQQEELFGEALQYINMIECHPEGPNSQTELCIDKDITGTPTWVMEPNGVEVKRHSGYMTIKELKEFSGCEVK